MYWLKTAHNSGSRLDCPAPFWGDSGELPRLCRIRGGWLRLGHLDGLAHLTGKWCVVASVGHTPLLIKFAPLFSLLWGQGFHGQQEVRLQYESIFQASVCIPYSNILLAKVSPKACPGSVCVRALPEGLE